MTAAADLGTALPETRSGDLGSGLDGPRLGQLGLGARGRTPGVDEVLAILHQLLLGDLVAALVVRGVDPVHVRVTAHVAAVAVFVGDVAVIVDLDMLVGARAPAVVDDFSGVTVHAVRVHVRIIFTCRGRSRDEHRS